MLAGIAFRAAIGFALAVSVAVVARRTRSLSRSGALAAVVLGTISLAAGFGWAILLISFFLTGTALSRYGSGRKAARITSVVEKGEERDALQVLANGGVFSVAALGAIIFPSPIWLGAGIGAIAAATSDTWATEVGTLAASPPRSILSGVPVPHGTSGGVTLRGSLAALAGAIFIGLVALASGWPAICFPAAIAGGVGGSTIDSLLGATLQQQRWCHRCSAGTERLVHACGTTTRHERGLQWLRNDAVNAISSVGGAIIGMVFFL